MFSELRHHPRYETVLVQKDPVPSFINKTYQDKALIDRQDTVFYGARDVGGEDRYKYFRRPNVPFSQVRYFYSILRDIATEEKLHYQNFHFHFLKEIREIS